MKASAMSIVLLAAVLTVGSQLAKAQSQTEIAIQGPWILYQDKQFTGSDGKPVPVLVAIAPANAIDYSDLGYSENNDPDMRYHRPPQLSTGDGYYITNRKIYCLAFSDSKANSPQCNPLAPTNSNDNYPPAEAINISHGSGSWQWWTVAGKDDGQTALILPMPDSISNDGTWPVKFATQFSPTGLGYDYDKDANGKPILEHSTGLILHYKQEPSWFGLTLCAAVPANGQNFGVKDCQQPATVGNNRMDTHLENSGTLRIEMKAPYDADGCDLHARMAQRIMALLLGDFAIKYSYIEPAFYDGADNIVFDDATNGYTCLTEESEKIGPGPGIPDYMKAGSMRARKHSGQGLPPTSQDLQALLGYFDKFDADLSADLKDLNLNTSFEEYSKSEKSRENDLADFTLAKMSVTQAKHIRDSLNTDFPRISQLRRIATLLQMSKKAIARQKNQPINRLLRHSWIDLSVIYEQLEDDNGPGKSAGDCLANLILVTDNP